MAPGGCLLIANEWREDANGLTPPTYALASLDKDRRWKRGRSSQHALDGSSLTIAVFHRTNAIGLPFETIAEVLRKKAGDAEERRIRWEKPKCGKGFWL